MIGCILTRGRRMRRNLHFGRGMNPAAVIKSVVIKSVVIKSVVIRAVVIWGRRIRKAR